MSRLPDSQNISLARRIRSQIRFHPVFIGPILLWRYRRHFGALPSFPPATFNEKLLHRLLFDRRPFLPVFAGKWEARGHVLAVTSDPSLLTDLVAIACNGEEFRQIALPEKFIVKVNHMSGLNYIHDGSKPLDMDWLAGRIDEWCARRHPRLEWGYDSTRRIVLVERLLDVNGQVPRDYKFFVFDGVVRFIEVDGNRFVSHRRDIFDREWRRLDLRYVYPNHEAPPLRPRSLERMISLAERISGGVDFVRVDLYDVDGDIRFGEMTNYPDGGRGLFEPREWDRIFGQAWHLPKPEGLPGFNLKA